jgi:hypothetical protein
MASDYLCDQDPDEEYTLALTPLDDKTTLQQRLVQKVLYNHKFLDFGPPPPRTLLTLEPTQKWSTGTLYGAAVALFFALSIVITTLGILKT